MCQVEGRLITHIEEQLQKIIQQRMLEEDRPRRDHSRKRGDRSRQRRNSPKRRKSRDLSSERSVTPDARRKGKEDKSSEDKKEVEKKEGEKKEVEKKEGERGRARSTHSHSHEHMGDSDDESLYVDVPFEGFLLKKNFDYILVDKEDIVSYTGKSETKINQLLRVPYQGSLQLVSHFVSQLYKDSRFDLKSDDDMVVINESIFITKDEEAGILVFKWVASKKNDVVADCLAYLFSQFPQDKGFDIFNVDSNLAPHEKQLENLQKKVIKRVSNVFQDSIYKIDRHHLSFRDRDFEFHIDLKKGKVDCKDETVRERVWSIISNLFPAPN